jgi:hypothetical protein
MKSLSLWVSAAAIGVTVGVAGSAWSQTATNSESSTVTTVPAPGVTSRTVTRSTVVSPPVVVASPDSSTTTRTTTEADAPGNAPTMQEKTRSDTTYGPGGVTHSETQEKSSSD